MKMSYKLCDLDFAINQLYIASKSEVLIKQRKKSKAIITLIFLLPAIYLIVSAKDETENYIIGSALILLAIYSWLKFESISKKSNIKLMIKYVNENFKNKIGAISEIEFTSNCISIKDEFTEGQLNQNGIKQLIELKDYFYIKSKKEAYLIIPKSEINDAELFKTTVSQYNVEYINELHWEWK